MVRLYWVLLLLPAGSAFAAQDYLPRIPNGDITVRLEQVAAGLVAPTDLVPDGSGRLFVMTLPRAIHLIDASGNLLPEAYLDTSSGDTGMTTMAFHPDFHNTGTTGYGNFYTLEPEKTEAGTPDFLPTFGASKLHHHDGLYEYTAADPGADAYEGSARREMLRALQPSHSHNFNDLVFGPDGLLYISTGDGANDASLAPNVRLETNLYGKILRSDRGHGHTRPVRHSRDKPFLWCRWRRAGGDLGIRPAQPLPHELRPLDRAALCGRRRSEEH